MKRFFIAICLLSISVAQVVFFPSKQSVFIVALLLVIAAWICTHELRAKAILFMNHIQGPYKSAEIQNFLRETKLVSACLVQNQAGYFSCEVTDANGKTTLLGGSKSAIDIWIRVSALINGQPEPEYLLSQLE
jgi:hypothetical protein